MADPYQQVAISDVYLPEHCPVIIFKLYKVYLMDNKWWKLNFFLKLGSVIHELGHVIGFRHEHTRIDRSAHIRVHYEKMQASQRSQYDIMVF